MLCALHTQHPNDFIANRDRNTKIRSRWYALGCTPNWALNSCTSLLMRRGSPDIIIFEVSPSPNFIGLHIITILIREIDHLGFLIQQGQVNNIGFKRSFNLVTNKFYQVIRIQLRSQCLTNAINRAQLSSSLLCFSQQVVVSSNNLAFSKATLMLLVIVVSSLISESVKAFSLSTF